MPVPLRLSANPGPGGSPLAFRPPTIMTEMILAVVAMFLVIIGGIAGLYYRLGSICQMGEDHEGRIERLEDHVFKVRG